MMTVLFSFESASADGAERTAQIAVFDERAAHGLRLRVEKKRRQLDNLAQVLQSLSHKSVLDRGFTLIRGQDGTVVARAQALPLQDTMLEIEFADGRVVTHYQPEERGSVSDKVSLQPASAKRGHGARKSHETQGNLL